MPFYWIADMRDEMSKWPWLLPINSRRLLFYERRILKDADLILSVSAPLVEDFKQIGGGIDKVIEITNGYDYEEVHDVSFQPVYTMAFIGHFTIRSLRTNGSEPSPNWSPRERFPPTAASSS